MVREIHGVGDWVDATPAELACDIGASCPSVWVEATPVQLRCGLGNCPSVWTERTPVEVMCSYGSCSSIHEGGGRVVVVGEVMTEGPGSPGQGEERVVIDAALLGNLVRAEADRMLREGAG